MWYLNVASKPYLLSQAFYGFLQRPTTTVTFTDSRWILFDVAGCVIHNQNMGMSYIVIYPDKNHLWI